MQYVVLSGLTVFTVLICIAEVCLLLAWYSSDKAALAMGVPESSGRFAVLKAVSALACQVRTVGGTVKPTQSFCTFSASTCFTPIIPTQNTSSHIWIPSTFIEGFMIPSTPPNQELIRGNHGETGKALQELPKDTLWNLPNAAFLSLSFFFACEGSPLGSSQQWWRVQLEPSPLVRNNHSLIKSKM